MDGPYYVDSRMPFISGDATAISTAATSKALMVVGYLPVLGGNYFSYIGKAVRIRCFGRVTTPASSPTLLFSWLWGDGTDANGTSICATAAMTTVSSQTNMSWTSEVIIRCRTTGSTGTLFGTGFFECNSAVVATNTQMIPATAPAASASVDLTAARVISPQATGGSATAITVQVHDFLFEALN